jgi:hypothetical protein
MACVNQIRLHCVNQMGKTQSKPLAERHGTWELGFILLYLACFGSSAPLAVCELWIVTVGD